MRVELNLATQPFGRNRLFWLACGLSALLLVLAAAALGAAYLRHRDPAPELLVRQQQLQTEQRRLAAAESKARAVLEDPKNEEVLERSLFLNELLFRKGISWTRTFADLEGVLPPRVLMVQIRPEITWDHVIRLDMQVGAETPEDFLEFLKALESSGLFGSPSLRGWAPPGENQPLYRYQLTVSYDQEL